jgi:hypothetical protein
MSGLICVIFQIDDAKSKRSCFDLGMLGHIVLMTCTVLVPGLLGALFLHSLSLHAPEGEYYSNNSTYIRPSYTDNRIFGMKIKATAPLFLSTLSSSLM